MSLQVSLNEMTDPTIRGIVLFGDIVRSRSRRDGARWLETLRSTLSAAYKTEAISRFEFTQGDELQGLIKPGADPFRGVLWAMLQPAARAPQMRWAIVAGEVDPGRGPATRRSGPAFLEARATLELARRQKDNLLVKTGHPDTDLLLDGTAPVLGSLVAQLTDRQREIARLVLVEGKRQSEVAEMLGVSRATISIAAKRAGVRDLARLLGVVRTLWSSRVVAEGSA